MNFGIQNDQEDVLWITKSTFSLLMLGLFFVAICHKRRDTTRVTQLVLFIWRNQMQGEVIVNTIMSFLSLFYQAPQCQIENQ